MATCTRCPDTGPLGHRRPPGPPQDRNSRHLLRSGQDRLPSPRHGGKTVWHQTRATSPP